MVYCVRRLKGFTIRIAVSTGFELDRNAPERRSGSLFKDRNGVPVHFLEIPNEIQIAKHKYWAIGVCYCTILGVYLRILDSVPEEAV